MLNSSGASVRGYYSGRIKYPISQIDKLKGSAANLGFGIKSFNFLYIGLVLHTLLHKAIEMVA